MVASLPEIETLPLYADMTAEERRELLAAGTVHSLAKGEQLFMHGEQLQCFYLLIDGVARQFRQTPEGKEITIGLAIRGDIIGTTHLFESVDTYQWSAVAVEPVTVLAYPVAGFRETLMTHRILALNLLAALSKQTHLAAIDAEHRVTLSAPQRIACFLLRLCALHHLDPRRFELPYSKTTIASKLGMEAETFSRSLKKLQAVGVEVEKAHLSIHDTHRLACFACGHCSIADDCATLSALNETTCSGSCSR